jgi:hypothetical protein
MPPHLSMQVWLFGYELPDLVLVLTDAKVLVIGSKKKIEFLTPLTKLDLGGGDDENPLPPIELLVRNKADSDAENFAKVRARPFALLHFCSAAGCACLLTVARASSHLEKETRIDCTLLRLFWTFSFFFSLALNCFPR